MPEEGSEDWIIWAAWADRITFEEIFEKTGLKEGDVIRLMRRSLKPSSFKRWRKRASTQSIKHRKVFQREREELNARQPQNWSPADEEV
jgi:uncharacterized protein (TIGR03643 family)